MEKETHQGRSLDFSAPALPPCPLDEYALRTAERTTNCGAAARLATARKLETNTRDVNIVSCIYVKLELRPLRMKEIEVLGKTRWKKEQDGQREVCSSVTKHQHPLLRSRG